MPKTELDELDDLLSGSFVHETPPPHVPKKQLNPHRSKVRKLEDDLKFRIEHSKQTKIIVSYIPQLCSHCGNKTHSVSSLHSILTGEDGTNISVSCTVDEYNKKDPDMVVEHRAESLVTVIACASCFPYETV